MCESSVDTIWNRDYILLLLINGSSGISFQILAPNLPVYAQQLGFSESLIGVLAASLAFGALLSRPFSGVMADGMNRKKITSFSLILTAIAVISLDWVSNPALLIGIRFLHGILFGINTTITMTMASAVIPENKMGQGIGIFSITGVGAQAVAPALGISIVAHWGYPTLFLCTAGISAIASPLPAALTDKVASRKTGGKSPNEKGFSLKGILATGVLGFACLAMFFTSVTSSVTSFIVLYGMGKGILNVGFYFTVYASALIAIRFFVGSLTDRSPFQWILFPCCAFCALSLIMISIANSFPALAVAAVFMGIGYGVSIPAIQAASIRSADPERRGIAVATIFGGMDLAHCIGPTLLGFIVEATSYRWGFLSMCAMMLGAIPTIIHLVRKKRIVAWSAASNESPE